MPHNQGGHTHTPRIQRGYPGYWMTSAKRCHGHEGYLQGHVPLQLVLGKVEPLQKRQIRNSGGEFLQSQAGELNVDEGGKRAQPQSERG